MLTRFSFARMSTPLPRRPDPVRLLLASRVSGGLRPSLAGSTLALTFSRPARRSFIFQPACSLAPHWEPFTPEASTRAVTSPSRSGCFRLEQQLPGGISSSHWSNAPFSWRTKDSGLCRIRHKPDHVGSCGMSDKFAQLPFLPLMASVSRPSNPT
jgi:hypothetical protein